ncbi:hypothetical protein EVAR_58170_1 [Eumeta japonica]|uniref:Uncharacterized protein n=1 Tax=Eumeta variegata TaxID=151549 RepID=A0A4C1WZB9_EUMVA|nr:hypothetical protein EVAR_58170_1 [Eumeta japonica]
MGYPQDSLLGPTLWNVLLSPAGIKAVPYADVVTVPMVMPSRSIEEWSQVALNPIREWGRPFVPTHARLLFAFIFPMLFRHSSRCSATATLSPSPTGLKDGRRPDLRPFTTRLVA